MIHICMCTHLLSVYVYVSMVSYCVRSLPHIHACTHTAPIHELKCTWSSVHNTHLHLIGTSQTFKCVGEIHWNVNTRASCQTIFTDWYFHFYGLFCLHFDWFQIVSLFKFLNIFYDIFWHQLAHFKDREHIKSSHKNKKASCCLWMWLDNTPIG